MNPHDSPVRDDALAAACQQFEAAWNAGQRPRIEDFLPRVPEALRAQLVGSLVRLDVHYRGLLGEVVAFDEYLQRFPAQAVLLQAFVAADTVLSDRSAGVSPSVPAPAAPASAEPTLPERLGRYRITARLGRGGFGVVYKGHDEELHRDVAIKVPHRDRVSRPADVEEYLNEARLLAGLDHAHIVPVYDVGRTDDGLCFVVSRYIEGSDLARRLKRGRFSPREAVELVAAIAEALHHAHRRNLVHRDVKPANILLDQTAKPYLADFGLALKEEDYGRGAGFAGTPAYMSPEQARGEGHRVDGRSDVFSLGVVFYELLTGRRPFRGESQRELLDHVAAAEPRPPRQVDDSVPKELERICLKALAKRASERYTTALDLAEDLRHWLGGVSVNPELSTPVLSTPVLSTPVLSTPEPTPPGIVRIVPKGLRSFDAGDADFFLDLLPGSRDRDGLPDSLRFWKGRIEETDADKTFTVGLLYGPSGCGKSSLVKAGLLPRLAGHVLAVYIEATPEETEARLLRGLRTRCPDLPANLDLVQTLAALRRGRGLNPGQKVLLVLDQFEQWLHAHREDEDTELVRALRQCDGVRLQAVVLVRDDFWMAATRFLRDLEVRLLEGHNSAAVDLFDPRHARKVLAAFGQAFGALPAAPTPDNDAFLEKAVTGLAEDGKIISVRLALFAEMVKGKPWTPATLRALGGVGGVGVVFLEETFSAKTAPPEHRLHQRAARGVLKALLPEQGSDIKGHMRSQKELLAASGYEGRPREFDHLLRILDGELRLITPTDPEGSADSSVFTVSRSQGATDRETINTERYYQLTHDYLVPALRDWLTRKQRETRRGRAELRLAERAALWNAKPESRFLPGAWEWLSIRLLTRRTDWTAPQHQMMRRAAQHHLFRAIALALPMGVLVLLLVAPFTREIVYEIKVAQQEIDGLSYLRELRQVMQHGAGALLPAQEYAAGKMIVRPHLLGWHALLVEDFGRLQKAEATQGQRLMTGPLHWRLTENWQALRERFDQLAPKDQVGLHQQLLQDVRKLMSRAGDTSRLSLDPDLDSSALVGALLIKLPAAQEYLVEARFLTGAADGKHRGTDCIRLTTLLEASFVEVERSLEEVAFKFRPAAGLDRRMRPCLDDYRKALRAFVKAVPEAAAARQVSRAESDNWSASAARALEANFRLWDRTSSELEQLLRDRIASLGSKLRLSYLAPGALLLLMATCWLYSMWRSS